MYLAVSLPPRSISEHYSATWFGFDIALVLVLTRISWFAHRRNPNLVLTASAGATLLVTDAWFDVATAAPGSAHTQALLAAVRLELPCAALCAMLARRGQRDRAAPHRRQHRRQHRSPRGRRFDDYRNRGRGTRGDRDDRDRAPRRQRVGPELS
ncbi:MAG: hypothetical protein M3Y19_08295 [Actinomycetota bacterium]|nr:hypothetical protein [Actinomycetota bacterium]